MGFHIYNTFKRAQCIVQRQILCRNTLMFRLVIRSISGWLLCLGALLMFGELMSIYCLCPFHGRGYIFTSDWSLVLQAQKGNCLVAWGWINSCKATHALRTRLSAVSPFRAPVGPDPIQIWCSCFDVYEPIAFKCRIMIQGLEKLLFIQMWLTPHHFKLAVLIMLIVLFVFWGFFAQICNLHLLWQDVECVLE